MFKYPTAKEANGFKMVSNEATRMTHIEPTFIGHVITQLLETNVNVLKQQSVFDHEVLLVTWNARTPETIFTSYKEFFQRGSI